MSFLKNLFEKRKDIKYGKGHKLGDSSSSQAAAAGINNQQQVKSNVAVETPRPQSSEASRKAGEAALARLQNKNTTPRPAYQSQLSKELEMKAKEQEKELAKALSMKEHYFGPAKVVESTSLIPKNQIRFKSAILGPDESYPKNEIEDRIEQALLVQLEDEPILVAVSLLFTANYQNQEKLNKCIEILNKFIDNILNSPNEEKYRKIRVENAVFKEKVYSCKYSDLVLRKGGFKPAKIKKTLEIVPQNDVQPADTDLEEDFFVYEGNNFEKLESLKEALSLGEPIVPQLDRDLKIYKITDSSSSSSGIAKFDLCEEFYNVTIEDLRREHKLRDEALEKQGMLRTKAMRERDEQLELKRYNYCLIRVRFPNDYILQALFKSNETYEELYKLVQSCLKYDWIPFELFGHTLKKTINLTSTLAEAGLAPSALINFKWNDDSVIEAAQLNLDLRDFIRHDLISDNSHLQ